MCTLTWLFNTDGEGYSLFFNRDELKSRQRALPPELMLSDSGVSYLSPIDTDAGGSWIAVNQFGLTVCLLNNYLADTPKRAVIKSRGSVITALADCASLTDVEQRLQSMPLDDYRGFDVVAILHDVAQWRWDTQCLTTIEPSMPLTSSSYDSLAVCDGRRTYFNSLENTDSLDVLEAFHSSHLDDNLTLIQHSPVTANSVCMHRDNAQTVSQCQVQVNSGQVSMIYIDGSPCCTRAGLPLSLQRRAVA